MPFTIIRNDIAAVSADVIVNTANPRPIIGDGVDRRLHEKAGLGLLMARKKIGNIAPGEAAVTRAFGLNAKYVIHTAGPVWQGGSVGEEELLRNCYKNSLRLALELGAESIAFPLISTGSYGFPKAFALQLATAEFIRFLSEHEMQITLVVFDRDSFALSGKLMSDVQSFIEERYVSSVLREGSAQFRSRRMEDAVFAPSAPAAASLLAERSAPALDDFLRQMDAGFSETLLRLIDRSGKKDPEVYKKANVDRKLFSKIRNNPQYRPSKATAVAFALALELDLEETKDLLGRAGYALTHSSKFDLVVEFFILQKNYDIFAINEILFALDQPLIGG